MTRFKTTALAALLLAMTIAPAAAFEAGVTTETTVEDFELTKLIINCPPGPWGSAFQWDMNRHDPGYDETIDRLLTKIDRRYGGWVRSKTTVKDGAVEKDLIVFKSRGSHKKGPGKELCQYLADKI